MYLFIMSYMCSSPSSTSLSFSFCSSELTYIVNTGDDMIRNDREFNHIRFTYVRSSSIEYRVKNSNEYHINYNFSLLLNKSSQLTYFPFTSLISRAPVEERRDYFSRICDGMKIVYEMDVDGSLGFISFRFMLFNASVRN